MKLITILLVLFFLNSNTYSQDYITYDKHIQKARNSLYTDVDTVASLEHFEKAFSYVKIPFSRHFYEYQQLICSTSFLRNNQKVYRYFYNFKDAGDKHLFFENNCHKEFDSNFNVLRKIEMRILVDNLFEKDQAIDRLSNNKREQFTDVIEEFKKIIETWGYPTEDKIGLHLNSRGGLVDSPVYILVLHAIQNEDPYFLNNLEVFFEKGLLLGSDYRTINNLMGN